MKRLIRFLVFTIIACGGLVAFVCGVTTHQLGLALAGGGLTLYALIQALMVDDRATTKETDHVD